LAACGSSGHVHPEAPRRQCGRSLAQQASVSDSAKRVLGILIDRLTLILALTLMVCATANAHDIPASATLQGWVHPQAESIDMVVRIPLRALRDVDYPQRGPGYLDMPKARSAVEEGVLRWLPQAFELRIDGKAVAPPSLQGWRASLESERPYASWQSAYAHVSSAALPDDMQVPWDQVMIDALLRWPVSGPVQTLSIDPKIDRFGLKVQMSLQALLPDGRTRAWSLHGNEGPVPLDAGLVDVIARFVSLGVLHVFGGMDHLLFVICLVIPIRRLSTMAGLITAFTVGHSLTLVAAALGATPDMPWFAPAVETAIAGSIVWLAIANMLSTGEPRHRWITAGLFGLIHGLGFALALGDGLQFAGDRLVSGLLAFNLGVEIGQLAVLLVVLPLLMAARHLGLPQRALNIVLSAFIAHAAWHWLTERSETLWRALGG
jgi:HupE / UreJ protein